MAEGYIKLHRGLQDNALYRKPAYLAVWIDILLNVNHSKQERIFRGVKIIVNEGEGIFFQRELAEKFNLSLGTVSNILKYLKSERQIELDTTNSFTIVKVTKWKEFQSSEHETEHAVNTAGTRDEHAVKHYKNEKNVKNEKNIKKTITNVIVQKEPQPNSFEEAEIHFRNLEVHLSKLSEYEKKEFKNEEYEKFFEYWTALTKTGRLRWRTEKTFAFKARLRNWMQRADGTTRSSFNSGKPPRGTIG